MSHSPFANSNDPTCDVCSELAVVQYADPQTESEYSYCDKHRRDPAVERQAVDWVTKRRRWLPVGNAVSEKMAMPMDSREHQNFQWEMCEGQLIGADGAVRYYFSVISGHDQFVAWDDQFVHDVTEFIVARTGESARQFIDNEVSPHWIDCLTAFFRQTWQQHLGIQAKKTKRLKAVELLLTHPDWTDEEIAKSVPTTLKQLQRNSDYTGLRSVPIRRARANAIADD